MNSGILFFLLIIRIIGVFVCSAKAKELNRNSSSWGLWGFISPIIAMIWVYCLSPVTIWHKNEDLKTKE